jgi:hypothetical protein
MSAPLSPSALATLAEAFEQLIELSAGHKEKCIARGFSPEAAEHMAVAFHTEMLGVAFRNGKQ